MHLHAEQRLLYSKDKIRKALLASVGRSGASDVHVSYENQDGCLLQRSRIAEKVRQIDSVALSVSPFLSYNKAF